jgi:Transposase IS200 like
VLFEKWPAGQPAACYSALSSPLNGVHCHCARVLVSLLFYAMRRNLKRYYGAGDLHFITCSCYRRQPLLGAARQRDLLLTVLEQVRKRYQFVVAGYVVMPEHIHLLISEPHRALVLNLSGKAKRCSALHGIFLSLTSLLSRGTRPPAPARKIRGAHTDNW